jgi:hypothetical protein
MTVELIAGQFHEPSSEEYYEGKMYRICSTHENGGKKMYRTLIGKPEG